MHHTHGGVMQICSPHVVESREPVNILAAVIITITNIIYAFVFQKEGRKPRSPFPGCTFAVARASNGLNRRGGPIPSTRITCATQFETHAIDPLVSRSSCGSQRWQGGQEFVRWTAHAGNGSLYEGRCFRPLGSFDTAVFKVCWFNCHEHKEINMSRTCVL